MWRPAHKLWSCAPSRGSNSRATASATRSTAHEPMKDARSPTAVPIRRLVGRGSRASGSRDCRGSSSFLTRGLSRKRLAGRELPILMMPPPHHLVEAAVVIFDTMLVRLARRPCRHTTCPSIPRLSLVTYEGRSELSRLAPALPCLLDHRTGAGWQAGARR